MAGPGPWMLYGSGRRVRCKVAVSRVRHAIDGTVINVCNDLLIVVGRRKLLLLRIVGNLESPVTEDVEGNTIRCACGTIYEMEWGDRRRQDRSQAPDRRSEREA